MLEINDDRRDLMILRSMLDENKSMIGNKSQCGGRAGSPVYLRPGLCATSTPSRKLEQLLALQVINMVGRCSTGIYHRNPLFAVLNTVCTI